MDALQQAYFWSAFCLVLFVYCVCLLCFCVRELLRDAALYDNPLIYHEDTFSDLPTPSRGVNIPQNRTEW